MSVQTRPIISFLALLWAATCFGQAPVTVPPPPIAFEPWRRVAQTEIAEEYATSFPSAVTTAYPENDIVPVRALLPQPRSAPVPVVIVLHYWGATDQRVERTLAAELNSRGVGAVLIALPYHLDRTPAGSRSGSLAIEPDPERIKATTIQSVLDVRRTVDWIQSRPEFDGARIGVSGTSLGALVATLAYALEPRLSSGSFMLGGADIAHILWNGSRVVSERERMRAAGLSEAKLRETLKEIEPLEYLPLRPPGQTLVVGARFDTVIPPASTERLVEALPNPHVLRLDTGHYGGFFIQRKLLRVVAQFFSATFEGREFRTPTRLYAPTLRIGVDFNARNGLQVAGGIDLWHDRNPRGFFATALVTPRGPQLFLGKEIGRGFAAGLSILRGGPAAGAFWSIIL